MLELLKDNMIFIYNVNEEMMPTNMLELLVSCNS